MGAVVANSNSDREVVISGVVSDIINVDVVDIQSRIDVKGAGDVIVVVVVVISDPKGKDVIDVEGIAVDLINVDVVVGSGIDVDWVGDVIEDDNEDELATVI